MAEILKISDNQVKIGTDEGKVITVPIATINYPNPKEGDQVKIYKDSNTYFVKKAPSITDNISKNNPDGSRTINKHLFVWVASFLFGGFGVDRFLRGQIGLGFCKLLFGWLTLGIWPLIDWIIALSKAYGTAYGNVEEITFDNYGNYTR